MLSYRDVVVCRAWTITKRDDQWWLTATTARVDRFLVRAKGLHFSAPREGGFWYWGIESLTVTDQQLVARLGPPEQ